MPKDSPAKPPLGFVVSAIVIFFASFLPWAKIPASALIGPDSEIPLAFPEMSLSISLNAWNGKINLMGLDLPNWLVVISAAGITAMRWGKQSGAWDVADFWLMGLAIYNVIVSIWVLLAAATGGSVGIGLILTIGATSWMLLTLIRQMNAIKWKALEASPKSP